MLVLAVLALAIAAPAAAAATAGLAPASGAAGARPALWVDGLAPHTAVGVRVGRGRTRLLFADGGGRIATTAAIPEGAGERTRVELRTADGRAAQLEYRLGSAWAHRRAVEVSDWQGHALRTSAILDQGKLLARMELFGLAPGSEAAASSRDRELGRATAGDRGVALIRAVLPDSAAGALVEATSGAVRLGARLPTPPAVLTAVGDIACAPRARATQVLCRHGDTAALAASMRPDAAALLGDIQYESGTLSAFRASFDRSWGRLAMPLRPVPGNHEYKTAGAAGYFQYFAEQAPWRPPPWYAYNLGPWHVVALNSNCEYTGCGPRSQQVEWLRADLAAHSGRCTLAYWHHPRYSSGFHGSDARTVTFWRVLQAAGAEVVLAGHDHNYERFAPQDAHGHADAAGIRSFVVGTGGKNFTALRSTLAPHSEYARDDMHGILVLKLYPDAYSWRYVGLDGHTVDYGRDGCH